MRYDSYALTVHTRAATPCSLPTLLRRAACNQGGGTRKSVAGHIFPYHAFLQSAQVLFEKGPTPHCARVWRWGVARNWRRDENRQGIEDRMLRGYLRGNFAGTVFDGYRSSANGAYCAPQLGESRSPFHFSGMVQAFSERCWKCTTGSAVDEASQSHHL